SDVFHCDEDTCIPKYWSCDGYKDCSTGNDEEACFRQVKSGDRIALRAECDPFEYLSHYYEYANTHGCPGWTMYEYDWIECKTEAWNIFAFNRSVGEDIRWGDWVVLQGNNEPSKNTYLSCKSDYYGKDQCKLSNECVSFTDPLGQAWSHPTCKNSIFKIIQRDREIGCAFREDFTYTTKECFGKPIDVNNEVYLLHSTTSHPYYLSADQGLSQAFVGLRDCPGPQLNQLDVDACGCERWFLF
ncbi:unnamed protein product, partial [Meganyctiphanes norvegica]